MRQFATLLFRCRFAKHRVPAIVHPVHNRAKLVVFILGARKYVDFYAQHAKRFEAYSCIPFEYLNPFLSAMCLQM